LRKSIDLSDDDISNFSKQFFPQMYTEFFDDLICGLKLILTYDYTPTVYINWY